MAARRGGLLCLPLALALLVGGSSSVPAAGPLPAASSEAFDSVLGNTASCHRACQLTYSLHTYPKVRAGPASRLPVGRAPPRSPSPSPGSPAEGRAGNTAPASPSLGLSLASLPSQPLLVLQSDRTYPGVSRTVALVEACPSPCLLKRCWTCL